MGIYTFLCFGILVQSTFFTSTHFYTLAVTIFFVIKLQMCKIVGFYGDILMQSFQNSAMQITFHQNQVFGKTV